MQLQSSIKGRLFNVRHSLSILISVIMEPVVMDFECLKGKQNEMVVKEAAVAGENIRESFRFETPITWRLTAPSRAG